MKTTNSKPRYLLSLAAGLGVAGLSYGAQAAPTQVSLTQANLGPKLQLAERPQLMAKARPASTERRGSKADRANRRAKMMAKLDTNKDGKVQISEILALKGAKLEARLRAMDTNHDGVIQPEERKAAKALHKGRDGHRGRKAKADRRAEGKRRGHAMKARGKGKAEGKAKGKSKRQGRSRTAAG